MQGAPRAARQPHAVLAPLRLATQTPPRRPALPPCPRRPVASHAASSADKLDDWQTRWRGSGEEEEDATPTAPHAAAADTGGAELRLADLLPREEDERPAWLVALHRAAPFLASPALLRRVAGTLAAVALVRLGAFVPLPGAAAAAPLPPTAAGASLDAAFGGDGGAADAVSALALGVGPAVNASWLLAAAGLDLPGNPFKRPLTDLRRSGREGNAELKMWVNGVTLTVALLAGWRTAVACVPPAAVPRATLTLAAGAMVVRWVSDWMEEGGLGDGVSLMICVSVLTGYGGSLLRCAVAARATAAPPAAIAAVAASCLLLVYVGIYITQLEVRLPLVSYRRRRAGAARSPRPPGVGGAPASAAAAREGASLPMRLAPAGMGPLLMASLVYHLLPSAVGLVHRAAGAALAAALAAPVAGPAAMATLIVAGEGAALAQSEAPKEMADWMESADTGLAGVPPGAATERRLRDVTVATRLAGALLLAGLYLAATAVDAAATRALGAPPAAVSLLLAAGFVTSAARQVSSLVRLPVLADALAAERRELRRLLVDGGGDEGGEGGGVVAV